MRRATLDPVTLNIHWTRLVSIVDEAAVTFRRTCFSTLVREGNDFAVVLTDADGRSIAQSARSIPAFIGTLPATVRHLLEKFPAESLAPDDYLITNDPWLGTGHVYDVSGAMPLFHGGALVGFAAVASHVPDIGGQIWGPGAREIYEEGLQLPPLKLLRGGVPDPALVAVIERNVRVPALTMGDLWGQIAACRMLQERLAVFLDETRVSLAALGGDVRRRSELAMREAIGRIPDGCYRSRVQQDGVEAPVVIACAVTVDGTSMSIDYTGSSAQRASATNVVPAYTFAYSAYTVKCLLESELPNNEGSFAPLSTFAPPGSILNPRYPAASGARQLVGQAVVPAIMGALAPVLPDRVRSQGSGSAVFTLVGEQHGRAYISVNFMSGGQGASSARDGYTTLSFPSNVGNTPIEVLEQSAPVLVRERCIRTRSGGTGVRRGGDGGVFEFEYRGDAPATVNFQIRCHELPPCGSASGGDGQRAKLRVNRRSVDPVRRHPLQFGDRVRIETAGGGGFGTPGPRPAGARSRRARGLTRRSRTGADGTRARRATPATRARRRGTRGGTAASRAGGSCPPRS